MNDSQQYNADVLVVGAGLSGMYAAQRLITSDDGSKRTVIVLDARHRIGGRLLTAEVAAQAGLGCGDLGGAWIWPNSERVMEQFLEEFNIKTVPMHTTGETMARTTPVNRIVLPTGQAERYAACGGGAVRVAGGAASMVQKMAFQVDDHPNNNLSIQLGTRVDSVEYDKNGVKITCSKSTSEAKSKNNNQDEKTTISTIQARAVILAAPPKVLVNTIQFHPPLPKQKLDSMIATPTWMEDYGKVSVSFPQNWWRRHNMSAISIDQVGIVSTWWEACSGIDGDGSKPTIAGFVSASGATTFRKILGKERRAEAMYDCIMEALKILYGVDDSKMGLHTDNSNIKAYGAADLDGLVVTKAGVTVTYKSWLEDIYTKVPITDDCEQAESSGFTFSTDYGDRDLQQSVGPIFFAGTETAPGSGHMEGAVIAAQRASDEVVQYLS